MVITVEWPYIVNGTGTFSWLILYVNAAIPVLQVCTVNLGMYIFYELWSCS